MRPPALLANFKFIVITAVGLYMFVWDTSLESPKMKMSSLMFQEFSLPQTHVPPNHNRILHPLTPPLL